MRHICLLILIAGLCHGVSKATACTARGRFPNDDVEECRGYTMCLLGGTNGFTQYKLICPVGFAYSHLEQQCTNATNYHCMSSFACNTTGSFEDISSKNCSWYIACPYGMDGIATARQVECPLDHIFDPVVAACVNSTAYNCSADVEQKTVPITESPEPPEPQNATIINVLTLGENGFNLSSDVFMNSADGISRKHVLVFAVLMFFNLN